MSFENKTISGIRGFVPYGTYPRKAKAQRIAKKLREEEWSGYQQLARVIKTRLGWTVYTRLGKNIRYGIKRKR